MPRFFRKPGEGFLNDGDGWTCDVRWRDGGVVMIVLRGFVMKGCREVWNVGWRREVSDNRMA